MRYYYNIDEPILTTLSIDAKDMDDAIAKIRHLMIWKLAKYRDEAIEIYTKDRCSLTFEELGNPEIYRKIFPKFWNQK